MAEFNAEPYWDDFEATNGALENNYMRILFRPGYAVQARELTQIQSILQNQIKQFGDHIFKDGSPVVGGHLTLNTGVSYLKLKKQDANGQDIDLEDFLGTVVYNSGSPKTRARVKQTFSSTNDRTLIVEYLRGSAFSQNQTITGGGKQAIVSDETDFSGTGSVVSINEGVFYVDGFFVTVAPQTIVLEPYSKTPTYRIGLEIDESTVTESEDNALLDPAQESFNYQAPGAHRYQFNLVLTKRALNSVDDSRFFELLRVENGVITKQVSYPVYSELEKTLARRTYDESGNYSVKSFVAEVTANTSGLSGSDDRFFVEIKPGKVYVKGFEFETIGTTKIDALRARTTKNNIDQEVNVYYGNRLQLANVVGSANGIVFSDQLDQIDLHCVANNGVILDANTHKYFATRVGTARLKNFDRTSATNEYFAYLTDINFTPITSQANGLSANASTLKVNQFFSATDNAYQNGVVTLTNTSGAQGNSAVVSRYDATNKLLYFSTEFAAVPQSGDLFTLSMPLGTVKSVIAVNAASSFSSANLQANIANGSKEFGLTFLQDTNSNKNLFLLPSKYVKYDSENGIEFFRRKIYKDVPFGSANGRATISTFDTEETISWGPTTFPNVVSNAEVLDNVIVVARTGANAGQIIDMTEGSRSVLKSGEKSITISTESASGTSFTADVYLTVKITGAEGGFKRSKTKTASPAALRTTDTFTNGTAVLGTGAPGVRIDAANGIVWNQFANTISKTAGVKQSLFVSDVIKINKVYDSGTLSACPSTSNMTDITDRYLFNSGQTDNYYDHASISLKPGATPPTGQTAILFDYFSSYSGKGYFLGSSYDEATLYDTEQIPIYLSSTGDLYQLRDTIDMRPIRESGIVVAPYTGATLNAKVFIASGSTTVNANLSLTQNTISPPLYTGALIRVNGEVREVANVVNTSAVVVTSAFTTNATNTAIEIVTPNFQFKQEASGGAVIHNPIASNMEIDYEYYLGRRDKLVVTKDKEFKLLSGIPSVDPVEPIEDVNSMPIYSFYIPPFTASLSSIDIKKIEQKRFTMEDIGKLEERINNLAEIISLNEKEKEALADPPKSTTNPNVDKPIYGLSGDEFVDNSVADIITDFQCSIENGYLGPYQIVKEFGLQPVNLADARVRDKLVTVPYSETSFAEQPLASVAGAKTVQTGPVKFEGTLTLTPESDYFFSQEFSPYSSDTSARDNEIKQENPTGESTVDTASSGIGGNKYTDDVYKNPPIVGDGILATGTSTITTPHFSNSPENIGEPTTTIDSPIKFTGVAPTTFVQNFWTGSPYIVGGDIQPEYDPGYLYQNKISVKPGGASIENESGTTDRS